jgi:hypothetical protein
MCLKYCIFLYKANCILSYSVCCWNPLILNLFYCVSCNNVGYKGSNNWNMIYIRYNSRKWQRKLQCNNILIYFKKMTPIKRSKFKTYSISWIQIIALTNNIPLKAYFGLDCWSFFWEDPEFICFSIIGTNF